MSVGCLASLHDAFRPIVLEGLGRCAARGIVVEFDDNGCLRTFEDQERDYRRYLAGGPLAAPPGESAHNFGLAVDIHVVVGGHAYWSGPTFESAKVLFEKAGGQFLAPQYNDPGHCQHPQWRQLAALGNNPVTNPPQPGTPPIPARVVTDVPLGGCR